MATNHTLSADTGWRRRRGSQKEALGYCFIFGHLAHSTCGQLYPNRILDRTVRNVPAGDRDQAKTP